MQKRKFLAAALGAASLPAFAHNNVPHESRSPVLLTVTGAITRTNRNAFDPVLDQMMAKQQLKFSKAHAFDFAALSALPARTIHPTLEYDNKKHQLSGPLLADVLQVAGVSGNVKLAMRAIDGYAPTVTLADARKYGYIVATQLDGHPMPLGGLGPLWALCEPDGFADMASKPLDQRFANCPWGLFHIEVTAA